MLDLQKAFDTVDHDILCRKLRAMGVESVEWFRSYLADRTQVRFNESDHDRATMVVPANNRRETIAVFNGERRSSIDRALFDILSSDRSLPPTPRLLKVSLTNWAPAGDFKTDFDGAKTIAPAEDNQTVCDGHSQTVYDGAKTLWTPARESQTVPDNAKTVLVPAGDSQTVSDGHPDRRSMTLERPSGRRQKTRTRCQTENLRQSATMLRPSGHLQETSRRCQTVSQTFEAPTEDSQTVVDGAKTVWAPAGDSQTVFDGLPRRSWHVAECMGFSCICPAGLGDCLAASQTVWKSPVCVMIVLTPSQTVWKSPAGAPPV
ncbi:hypothetical protein DPMN_029232 [Dreissena polymorpha]|uniref:Reverse transcriptase domain-containing protein n=1 Tax=Dreissena polymorpha TaxID=45954 RepID=A0A9D4RH70_DREPO|nr:hypothetical protein DPMN_029232 [Dreissena polymorpha]